MFDSRITLRIGAVVTTLLIAAVVVVLQVDLRALGPTVRVQVYLEHPGPLRAEAAVQLAGREIGRVDTIRLVTSNEARSADHPLHPAGGVVLEVRVRKKYLRWVRKNSELFVNSKGLIGEAYLEVAPPLATEDMLASIAEGDRLRGVDPARMEHIIVTSFLNARRFGTLLEELEPSMDQLKAESFELAETLAKLELEVEPGTYQAIRASASDASGSFDELRATLSADNLTSFSALERSSKRLVKLVRAELGSMSADLDLLSARIDAVRARLPADLGAKYSRAIADARTNVATLESTISKLEDLAERVAAGHGTVGALMNDPEFSDDAKQLGRYLKRHPWKIITKPPK
jgi:ABC-type transporter Mla subunit MlaD